MTESFIAEVTIDHPDLPLTPTTRDVADVRVQVESQPPARQESPPIFYSVSGTDFDRFETALAADPTVATWREMMTLDDCRLYQVAPSPAAKFTTQKIAELGVRVLSIGSTDRGWRFRLQAPNKETLGAYWQYCRDEGVRFTLEQIYRSGPQARPVDGDGFTARLTDRQREVARTAARMGYYEPGGASAQEVAEELEISPSTLSTHLRRIVAKLFSCAFDEAEREPDR